MKQNILLNAVIALVVVVLLACDCALGEPGYWQLIHSSDPLLVQARDVDLHFQPPDRANQQEAERLYLEFIKRNPDDPIIPGLYYHLAHMYTDKVDPRWGARYSHVSDYQKGRTYLKEAIDRHPPDKLSGLLINARVSAASVAPTKEDAVAEYIDYYQSLAEMTKADLDAKLWLSEYEERLVEGDPQRKQIWVDTLWKSRSQMMEVAATNMVGAAAGSDDPIALLDRIITALPDKPPGQSARRRKAELLRRHPRLNVTEQNVVYVPGM